jgi:hypothetical protein
MKDNNSLLPCREALKALDGMAETWTEKNGIAQSIRSVPLGLPKGELTERAYELILRHVKSAYVEGLYNGRTSHAIQRAAEPDGGVGAFSNETLILAFLVRKYQEELNGVNTEINGGVSHARHWGYCVALNEVREFLIGLEHRALRTHTQPQQAGVDVTPDELAALKDALWDAVEGLRYIRKNHGDLYGVGFDRVEEKYEALRPLYARNAINQHSESEG